MPSTSRAGGCFLTIFLLLGFVCGLAARKPLEGTMIGLGVGVIFALATWLIDLRRRR